MSEDGEQEHEVHRDINTVCHRLEAAEYGMRRAAQRRNRSGNISERMLQHPVTPRQTLSCIMT